jgi:glycosyltransferase involved in cell wall biosynthesis
MTRTRVALIIPAWDEAGAIGAVLSEIPPATVDEVFVVVGSAWDPTARVAAAHGARAVVQRRPGYGAACLDGARAAMGLGAEVVAFLDGDYSDPPTELPRVLGPILAGEADLALGCRDLSAHPDSLPFHARLGNRLVLGALRPLLRRPLRDLPSFKAIRADTLSSLHLGEMTYGWTVEMVVKAVRAGLRIAEVPVAYRPRLAGRSKVSGTVRGTLGAAWKLCSCAARYAAWTPDARGLPTAEMAA